jgi:Lysylphosphatidylglycerol synthase TM region
VTRAGRQAIVSVVGATVGVVLFAWSVNRVGVGALVDAVQRVGWGALAILAIGGLRFAVRAQCWRLCMPRGVSLDYPHAFSAFLAGDAVGNVTPLGLLASEPTKVLLTRHHLATLDSAASLTLENILYTFSVLAMLAFGLSLLLTALTVPAVIRWAAMGALVVIVTVIALAIVVLRAPVGPLTHPRSSWRGRLTRLRTEVSRFATDHPRRLMQVFALQVLFHVLAVWETYLTLEWLLGEGSPSAVQAILFETVNRLTTVLFKFVPFRLGVDEATSGAVASLFAVTTAAGVALALIRRGRVLFWSAVGLLLIATHPATPTTAADGQAGFRSVQ